MEYKKIFQIFNLKVIITFQLAILGLIALDMINIQIPLLRQIIGFVYLTFIPGILILRIFRFNKISNIEILLYGSGLSLTILMIIGLFLNSLYYLGIYKPITLFSLIVTISIFVLVLCVISYLRDKNNMHTLKNEILNYNTLQHLFLSVLPIFAILGGFLVNYYNNNIILIVLVLFITAIPIMVVFNKLSKETYAFALFMIGIAILLQATMVSQYPMRINADGEYYYLNLVLQSGFWNPSLLNDVNSAISVVLLIPIYSLILKTDVMWVFKLIYPIIFSLLPVALYKIYDNQIRPKYAFISVFLFLSMFYFYMEAPLLRRQEIGLFFLSLMILLFIDNRLSSTQRSFLMILFAVSLIISHYSIGYISMIIISLSFILSFIINTHQFKYLNKKLKKMLNLKSNEVSSINKHKSVFTVSFTILFIVLALSWYIYSAEGSSFVHVTGVVQSIFSNIGGFLDPTSKSPVISSALEGGFVSHSFLNQIYRILTYIIQFFIIVGFMSLVSKSNSFKEEYKILSSIFLFVLVISIILPFISIQINFYRLYFILLMVLAPFCIIGLEFFWKLILKFNQSILKNYLNRFSLFKSKNFIVCFVLIILTPYFLFNIGFISAMGEFNQDDIDKYGIPISPSLNLGKVDSGYYNLEEIDSAKHLSTIINNDQYIYADAYYGVDLVSTWHGTKTRPFVQKDLKWNESYVFLRTWDLEKKEIYMLTYNGDRREPKYISLDENLFGQRDVILDNGGTTLFH